MTNFTKTRVDDLEDLAAARGAGEIGESRFARTHLSSTQTGLAFHRLNANKRQPFGHAHEQAEEVFYVLKGSGRVRLDDEIIELTERDILRVAPTVKRRFEAGDDGLEFVAFGQHFEGDGELLPDFWKD